MSYVCDINYMIPNLGGPLFHSGKIIRRIVISNVKHCRFGFKADVLSASKDEVHVCFDKDGDEMIVKLSDIRPL